MLQNNNNKKVLPEYLSSSQRGILSLNHYRNPGTIINMWARGPNSLAQDRFSDEKQRSPDSYSHKGLIDIVWWKEYGCQGTEQPDRKQSFGCGGCMVMAGRGGFLPYFKAPYIFTRAFSKFIPSSGLCHWLRGISLQHRCHRSQNNPG